MFTLYEHQKDSVAHLCDILGGPSPFAVDASDPGTGKTLIAVEVMRRFNLPTLVVCPKPVRAGWLRTALAQETELDVINYEMLRTGKTPYGKWYVPKYCRKPRFQFHEGIKMVILDEAHWCKSPVSKNAELMRAVKRQGIRGLALSATFADTPMELDALGYFLGLHDSNTPPTLGHLDPVDFYKWARRHGCGPTLFSKFEFAGSASEKMKIMAKLNREIFPAKGVRVRINDLDWFPEIQIFAELYDMDDGGKINQYYEQMHAEIEALNARNAECEAARLERARENGFKGDSLPPDPLTVFLRLRQLVELLKVPALVAMTQDALAAGQSVVNFVNFQMTLQALNSALQTDCCIDGTQVGKQGELRREHNRLRFQNDECRVINCISEAGGVGLDLHDTIGNHPRVEHVSPGFNAKLMRQIFGRVRRAGGKTKAQVRIFFAANTCEESIQRKVAGKLDRLDALQDGDLLPDNLRLTNYLPTT